MRCAGVPLPYLRQYLLVADASQNNPDIAKLLEKGKAIDITASEEMKIYFGADGSHFLLYLFGPEKRLPGLGVRPGQQPS